MRILPESKDFSQEYVANKLDMHQRTYSNLESGKTKLTIDRIKQLAEFYQVGPDYFLSDELPTINYNSGKYSRSIIAANTYKEVNKTDSKELFKRIIKEKEIQIDHLVKELSQLRKERENLINLITALTEKIK